MSAAVIPTSRPAWPGWLLFAAVIFVLLFARAMNRPFDLDEHQFVTPALLLQKDGSQPYADYPYFHMPTLIFLYRGLIGWTSYKLLAARFLAVCFGTATVLLLCASAWRTLAMIATPARRWIVGGLATLYITSRMFTYTNGYAWNHDPATLCLLGAWLLHLRGLGQARIGYFALAGLLIGAAIGIRLSFALTFLPFVASLILSRSTLSGRARLGALSLAAGAALLALLPAIVYMLQVPDQFFFGNLGYAALSTRYYAGVQKTATSIPGKFWHLGQTFLTDPSNAALFLLAGGSLFLACRRWRDWAGQRDALLLLLGLLPMLVVGAMGPTPAQYQYYYLLMPWLFLAVVHGIAVCAAEPGFVRNSVRMIGGVAVACAVIGMPRWYWNVIYLPTPQRWVPVAVHRTGVWVGEHVAADARVLTIEPLVPLEGGLAVYPEYAVGRFIMHVGSFMTADDRKRYDMAWGEQLAALLRRRPPGAVLLYTRTRTMVPGFEAYAREHGLEPIDSPDGDYQLWAPPAKAVTARR